MRTLSLLALAVAGAACSAAPDLESPRTAPEAAYAPSDSEVATTSAAETARQVFTIGEGHEVTVVRYDDGTLLVAETGTLDRDEPVVGESVSLGKAGITSMMRRIAPGAALDPKLLVDPVAKLPRAPEMHVLSAVPTTLPSSTGSLVTTSDAAIYGLLKCDDPSIASCIPASTGSATTDYVAGGWHRANAVNRSASTTATLEISVGNASLLQVQASVTVPKYGWAFVHRLNPVQTSLRARVIGASTATVGVSIRATEIAPRSQEQFTWCWATVTQAVLGSLGQEQEQCFIVAKHFNLSTTVACGQTYRATCNGGAPTYPNCRGEATQALYEQGYKWNRVDGLADAATRGQNALRFEQALQTGPLVLHRSGHYVTLSDYREVVENGVRVKKALLEENGDSSNNQESIARWVSLDTLAVADGGQYDFALMDIRRDPRNLANLETRISRVAWNGTNATIHAEHGPGITEYDFHVRDAGGTTLGAQWGTDVTVSSKSYPEVANGGTIWWNDSTDVTLPTPIGAWVWYAGEARGCRWDWQVSSTSPLSAPKYVRTCGAWQSLRSVSLKPLVYVDALTSASGSTSVTVHADAAPAGTFYRYRFLDGTSAKRWQLLSVKGTPASSTKTVLPPFRFAAGKSVEFEVQACSQNGCGDWVSRTFTTR